MYEGQGGAIVEVMTPMASEDLTFSARLSDGGSVDLVPTGFPSGFELAVGDLVLAEMESGLAWPYVESIHQDGRTVWLSRRAGGEAGRVIHVESESERSARGTSSNARH